MDAKYLKETVADALTKGVAAAAIAQPADSVDYLGKYLLQYVSSARARIAEEAEHKQAAKLLADRAAAEAEEAKIVAARGAKAAALDKEGQAQVAALSKAEEIDEDVLSAALSHIAEATGSAAAYIGRKQSGGEDGGGAVEYIAASKGSEFVLGQSIDEGKGVVWGVWAKPGGGDEEEEEEPEEDGEDGESKKKPEPEVPIVNVPSVTRNRQVEFLRMPRLGAFLAVPFGYNDLTHDSAIPDAPPAAAEGGDDDGEEKGKEEEVPSIPAGNGIPVSLVLCLDTVGQNREYTASDVEKAKHWAGVLAAQLQRTEQAQYEEEYNRQQEDKTSNAKRLDNMSKKKDDEAKQEAKAYEAHMKKLKGDVSEEDKALHEAQFRLTSAQKKVNKMKSIIAEIKRRRVAPKGISLNVLKATLYMIGYKHGDVCDKYARDKTAVQWKRARMLFNDEFFNRIKDLDPSADSKPADKYGKTANIAKLLEGAHEDDVEKSSVAIATLLTYTKAAVALRAAGEKKREKDAAAAAAAAAAEEAKGDE